MSETQDTQKELELLKVEESADGSAVIEVAGGEPEPENTVKEVKPRAQDDDSDDDDDDDDDHEPKMAEGGQPDADMEAIREARRNKRRARKEMRKQAEAERAAKLAHLEREVQAYREKMAILERKTHGAEVAQIGKAIEDQDTRIAFAKAKMKEAAETGNGELLAQAQEMWYEARKKKDALDLLKTKVTAPQQKETNIQPPNPMVQRYATEWMGQNKWYDPSGRDQDSAIALEVDKRLSSEGFQPDTKEYWGELDRRLRKYLPHRYTESEDEQFVQPVRKPRAVVTGSGREGSTNTSSGRNTITLTPEQVRAMKDAGMWDDQEKRNRMIKRYAEAARSQRS